MTQQKAPTLQQRFGFSDPDLTSPKHDYLLLELDRMVGEWISARHKNDCEIVEKVWEYPILGVNKFTIGFIDMCVRVRIGPRHNFFEQLYLFEVKPVIPSVGEVMRQIRMYQTYVKGQYFIVSPDTRFVSIFEAQGIGFFHIVTEEELIASGL